MSKFPKLSPKWTVSFGNLLFNYKLKATGNKTVFIQAISSYK